MRPGGPAKALLVRQNQRTGPDGHRQGGRPAQPTNIKLAAVEQHTVTARWPSTPWALNCTTTPRCRPDHTFQYIPALPPTSILTRHSTDAATPAVHTLLCNKRQALRRTKLDSSGALTAGIDYISVHVLTIHAGCDKPHRTASVESSSILATAAPGLNRYTWTKPALSYTRLSLAHLHYAEC